MNLPVIIGIARSLDARDVVLSHINAIQLGSLNDALQLQGMNEQTQQENASSNENKLCAANV